MGPTDDEVDEEDEEDFPSPPPRLARAGERLLEEAAQRRDRNLDDRVALFGVLERVGGLSAFCFEHAGLLGSTLDPEAATDDERAEEAERDGGFARACADELALIAGLAVRFAVGLLASLTPDWEDEADTTADIRADLMNELAVLSGRPPYPLAATRRDVADEVQRHLRTAALDIAQAAHELGDARFPGQASVTMIDLAAQALYTGMLIADAAGHRGWPPLEDDQADQGWC